MENTKANVDAFSAEVDEIKKYILDRSIKKIDNILKKTIKIRKMNAEFYGRICCLRKRQRNKSKIRKK